VCTFQNKHIPKQAGFTWDAKNKRWHTNDEFNARKLINFAIPDVKARLQESKSKAEEMETLSRSGTSDAEIPIPAGLEYLPFQKAGINLALQMMHDGDGVLIADEMGLGKTIQAIGVINSTPYRKILVLCPASLKLNWRNEMRKWLVNKNMSIGVAFSNLPWPRTDVIIINYDILTQPCKFCKGKPKEVKKACLKCKGKGSKIIFPELLNMWDVIIADECHTCKNPQTNRTKMFMRLDGRIKLALTGTPILNKPIEIQTILSWLDKKTWGNRWAFANRYCGMYKDQYGMHMDGASNLPELQKKMRQSLMIRRLKKDVLKDLPPKFRQVIELPAAGLEGAIKEEWEAHKNLEASIENLKIAVQLAKTSENDEDYSNAVAKLKEGRNAAFTEMARIRVEIAEKKTPYIITHLKEALESGNKIVFFAHHHIMIDAVKDKFKGCVVITGKTSLTNRQKAVDSFQKDPKVLLFVGNMKAAGVGLTLTASCHVIFGELDWVPANLSQAEDRTHRIGQKDNVLIQHLVLEGSLDSVMAKRVIAKQGMIKMALDDTTEFEEEVFEVDDSACGNTTRKEIVAKAPALNPQYVHIILKAIKLVSNACNGARTLDGTGFSKIDAGIGHSFASQSSLSQKQAWLALKIANKYRKQLPDEVSERITAIIHEYDTESVQNM